MEGAVRQPGSDLGHGVVAQLLHDTVDLRIEPLDGIDC